MKLTQLMYSSSLKDKNETLLAEILTASQRNNLRNAITGMIFHADDCLVHVLEGPTCAVDRVFKRIARDTRHYNLNFIGSKRIVQREYLEWDMGYLKINDKNIDKSFGHHAVFDVGTHHFDARFAHDLSCEVLRSIASGLR
jgi:hypothetical protein